MPRKVRRRKKVKLKKGRITIALIILVILLFALTKILNFAKNSIKIITKEYYLSSNINEIDLYTYNEETKQMEKDSNSTMVRGNKVKSHDNTKTIDEINYIEILKDDTKYYIKEENLTKDKNNVVTEKEKYVRTSVTVYKNEEDSKIASFIKKGNKLEILGYDYLKDDGNVNMYKIKKDNIEGWVYQKYLVDTEEAAKAVYNENGVYDIHNIRLLSI